VWGRPSWWPGSPPVDRAAPDDAKDGPRVSNAVAGLGVPAAGCDARHTHPTHGYEPTREAAMAAFAKSRREGEERPGVRYLRSRLEGREG
jgi:hypothetical protein